MTIEDSNPCEAIKSPDCLDEWLTGGNDPGETAASASSEMAKSSQDCMETADEDDDDIAEDIDAK